MAAKTAKARGGMLTVNLADEGRLRAMRTVLGYESVVRGLSVSQALVDMVLEAADTASYPDELRADLDEIAGRCARRAAVRAAQSADVARSA